MSMTTRPPDLLKALKNSSNYGSPPLPQKFPVLQMNMEELVYGG
jgi:hypothetical protein